MLAPQSCRLPGGHNEGGVVLSVSRLRLTVPLSSPRSDPSDEEAASGPRFSVLLQSLLYPILPCSMCNVDREAEGTVPVPVPGTRRRRGILPVARVIMTGLGVTRD